jgi:cell division protein FtsB
MRWLSLHSKKDACRAAHAAAFTTFKTAWDAAKAAPAPPAEDPIPPSSCDSIASLWEECKSNKKMTEMVADLEDRVLEESECLDDDPCFRPEEGFKVAISTAIGYKQKFEKSEQEMEELVAAHDDEIRELRGVIRTQVDTIRCLETMVKDQQCEIVHLRAENTRLRKEIEELQDENNALRVEISQLRAEITQLREENGTLRSEVGSLKDEMALMREQMVAMQKEFDAYKKAYPV